MKITFATHPALNVGERRTQVDLDGQSTVADALKRASMMLSLWLSAMASSKQWVVMTKDDVKLDADRITLDELSTIGQDLLYVSLEDRVPDNPLDDEGGEHSSKKCESESTAEADTLWGPKNNMPEYDCPSIPRDAFTEAEILLYEEVRETRVVYICTICIFRIFSYICD
eukprot:GHVU01224494.1.p1 GENE.GHVU01224494.1~~GHVU01224494.1.p1  ORF type:complete len:170 (-),score=13.84 GHVU01224494.1:978-1487(-)